MTRGDVLRRDKEHIRSWGYFQQLEAVLNVVLDDELLRKRGEPHWVRALFQTWPSDVPPTARRGVEAMTPAAAAPATAFATAFAAASLPLRTWPNRSRVPTRAKQLWVKHPGGDGVTYNCSARQWRLNQPRNRKAEVEHDKWWRVANTQYTDTVLGKRAGF